MRVHHLNCGTMNMPTYPMVAHVFLVETDRNGLVLVDSGFGLADIANPAVRVGPMRHLIKPAFDPNETALRQIERLGFTREDVRHIIVTHLDMDHIGGIADFPHAKIHTTAAEMLAAVITPGRRERARYRSAQWAHGAQFVEHSPGGESWRGFPAAKELTSIAPGLVLIPTPGHSRGHACVAVDADDHWLLHCGDAFYHWGAIHGRTPIPWPVKAMESLATYDRAKLRENQQRIAELHRLDQPDLRIVSAHDPADLAAFATS
ncbi:MBL fold metallo-hydrolase [Nocardia sp. CDC160]|uniref:MBL fold metallo-hydrolase n=1 Tax=Nocardia sp. CDC160 TaxID=3112166 RepID=UPI002DBF97A7|nr:MBL fold metallo-hydrolase [Nocardia sp. CDC160]MEC3918803.1 MBL fold metallo-hydrolase [Nocardia sp. CDC160]